MKEEIQELLYEGHPKIFKDKDLPRAESCMARGIETEDGWSELIDRLCFELQSKTILNSYPQVVAEQVKQRFGRLNFLFRIEETEDSKKKKRPRAEDYIRGMVHFAESMSEMICEKCGANGQSYGVVPRKFVRCDACYEEIADHVDDDVEKVSKKKPYFEVLERYREEGRRAVMFSQRLHPNPRFYKYYWHVFSRYSKYEGDEFFEKCRMTTYEAIKEIKRLDNANEPYMLFNYSLPRSGPDTPFNKNKSKHWAPSYNEDSDLPVSDGGHK